MSDYDWHTYGTDGEQRRVRDLKFKRSVMWYVSSRWAKRLGDIGAILFIHGKVALERFGFESVSDGCAWADRQNIPPPPKRDLKLEPIGRRKAERGFDYFARLHIAPDWRLRVKIPKKLFEELSKDALLGDG